MTTYKLTYFDLRGAAEPIRLLFAYAGVSYEDIHIESKKWPELKKTFKWQQVPFLEFDGQTLTQIPAIVNYLARKFGLCPDDIWEQARIEEIIGAINDLRARVKPLILAKFVERKPANEVEEIKQQVLATAPLFLQNMNDILMEMHKKQSKSDFAMGGEEPTAADFYLAHSLEQWEEVLQDPNLLDKYDFLKKQRKALFSLPKVAEWVEKRPKFPM